MGYEENVVERPAQKMRRLVHERECIKNEIRNRNQALRDLNNEIHATSGELNKRMLYAVNQSEVLVYDNQTHTWQIRLMCGG
jgi:hypothetical protein